MKKCKACDAIKTSERSREKTDEADVSSGALETEYVDRRVDRCIYVKPQLVKQARERIPEERENKKDKNVKAQDTKEPRSILTVCFSSMNPKNQSEKLLQTRGGQVLLFSLCFYFEICINWTCLATELVKATTRNFNLVLIWRPLWTKVVLF